MENPDIRKKPETIEVKICRLFSYAPGLGPAPGASRQRFAPHPFKTWKQGGIIMKHVRKLLAVLLGAALLLGTAGCGGPSEASSSALAG